jgi:hypothetical protein
MSDSEWSGNSRDFDSPAVGCRHRSGVSSNSLLHKELGLAVAGRLPGRRAGDRSVVNVAPFRDRISSLPAQFCRNSWLDTVLST